MKQWQINVTRFFHLSLEMLLLFLIIIPLYFIENQSPPIFPFVVTVLTAIIFYDPFVRKYKNEKIGLILVPIITLVGISLGYNIGFAFILAAIVFGRVLFHNKDHDPNEIGLFIVTFIVGVIYFLGFFFMEGREIFLYITFGHFFLTLTLTVIKLSFQSSKALGDKYTIIKWQLGKVLAIGILTSLGILLYPIIYKVVYTIFQGSILLFGLLGIPFVYLASLINLEVRPQNPDDGTGMLGAATGDYDLTEPATYNLDFLIWIAGAIFVLIILFLMLRKNGSIMLRSEVAISDDYELSPAKKKITDPHSWFKRTAPKNEIRRLLYDLEKFLAKQGEGRMPNETVEDWFSKINVSTDLKEVVSTTYRKVRYGDKEVTKQERDEYRRVIKEIKKQLKNQ
ncbi:hypothetical protein BKP35_17130 [Anaerobacillus arseniciselenatis]|uniref:DUF4129 domain-containing protein n=1 Tax=Anaerobacillus arseniciselenatis TaxID=85682 RepID=A0A1S2L9U5_9BACI|nr:hypothetical protein [Anaerobacillus arseniciselenatis]OIJ09259.1 hypothetical protein BKP35_17130 [Anaerobacillus arseniciselenatis]